MMKEAIQMMINILSIFIGKSLTIGHERSILVKFVMNI